MRFLPSARRADHPRRLRRLASCLILVAPLAAAACVTPDQTNSKADSAVDNRVRDVAFHHEACEPNSDSKTVDVNNDGRPDIVHVMKGGREVCRIVDLNFDGAVDVYIYYDDAGKERRREADFDRDGRPDQISTYKDGQLVENDRETNYDDKVDTWDYYTNGVLTRRERDSDGDGIIDQWWQFYDPARPKCAVVAVDHNADGKPDTDGQVDLCGEGNKGVSGPPGAVPGTLPTGTTPNASAAPGASAAPSAPPAASGEPSPSAAPSANAPAQNP